MKYICGDFSPDLESTTPNITLDANWVYRTTGGWAAIPPMYLISTASLPSQCYGALGVPLLTGSYQIVAGVQSQLYTLNGSNVFVSAGITSSATTNWDFAVYGNDLIASNGVNAPYVSTSGGAFGNLGGSPPVFSLVCATDTSLFGIQPNSNSGFFTLNDTIWTPNIATLCGTFSLTSTPGIITAMESLRSGAVIYKETAMYSASYTANPAQLWSFQKLSETVGCVSSNAVVSTGTQHYFVGPDNFYTCDGYNVVPIPGNVQNFFFKNSLYTPLSNLIRGVYDYLNDQVLWWYPTDNTGALNSYISLSTTTGMWSKGTLGVDTPVFLKPSPSAINTQFGAASSLIAVLNSHSLGVSGPTAAGTYASGAPFVTTGSLGDENNLFTINRVRPHFKQYPQFTKSNQPNYPNLTPKLTVLGEYIQGTGYTTAVDAVPISQVGTYDFVTANRLQRLKFLMSTGFLLASAEIEMEMQGSQ